RPAGGDQEYKIPAGQRVALSAQAPRPVATLARGAAHEAFAQLFAEPFDASAIAASRADPVELGDAAEPPSGLRTARLLALAAGAAAVAALGTSASLTLAGLHQRDLALAATEGSDRAAINER